MHIFFSGIGGAAIGPLALLAHQAGHIVSGSDKQNSSYISYLKNYGVNDIQIGQDFEYIAQIHQANPIDWLVYSSAVSIENPNAPELAFCRENNIRISKRDELLNEIIHSKNLKLIAIAGTHGKTTTTSMAVWLAGQLRLPVSYTLAAKTSFGDMAHYDQNAQYFIYECDEYDRNFLQFSPYTSLVTGIDWDHPDIFPTRQDYLDAFAEFIKQSDRTYIWQADADQLSLKPTNSVQVLPDQPESLAQLNLPGEVNRRDAWLVAQAFLALTDKPLDDLIKILNSFPGVSRRFEKLREGLYSDYAHTPPKIRGALQVGHEIAGENLVVVYEGLHNTRQHFIRDELVSIFEAVKHLYIVPSYLAREDETLELLSPDKLREGLSVATKAKTTTSLLDKALHDAIERHLTAGDTVLCLSAGGGNSLDEWLRKEYSS